MLIQLSSYHAKTKALSNVNGEMVPQSTATYSSNLSDNQTKGILSLEVT